MPDVRRRRSDLTVARQILLLQVLVVLVLVLASVALAAYDARRDARRTATERAVAVASTLADSPSLTAALERPDPSGDIQPLAERVRTDSSVDFVTVMSLDRIRYSHPNSTLIGRRFIGEVGKAPEGATFTQQYTGTLGPSMRAVVPVRDPARDDRVVAMVAVGITVARIDRQLGGDLVLIGLAALAVLAVGTGGALLVSRRLRRQTHGLGEREITRMYEYYSAVLHAVREGLVLLDPDGRVQLVNDEARRLLDLPEDVVGRPLGSLGLAPGLVAAALGATAETDEVWLAGDRAVVVSSAPASWEGAEVGAVVTLRDHTELRAVTGELDVVRALTESLRSQNHEAANRLHAVVSLIELGRTEEAVDFATEELQVAQLLADRVLGRVGDPVVAALLLGKTADAAERGVDLMISGELPDLGHLGVATRELVTVVGNLIDNAFEAVAESAPGRRRIEVDLGSSPGVLRVVVRDSGPGLDDEAARHALDRGWSTKAGGGRGVGLALVAQVARRHGGEVAIGRAVLGGAEMVITLRTASDPVVAGAAGGSS